MLFIVQLTVMQHWHMIACLRGAFSINTSKIFCKLKPVAVTTTVTTTQRRNSVATTQRQKPVTTTERRKPMATNTATKFPALYPSCTSHSHCPRKTEFCSTQCWTGGCGADGNAARGTSRQYCQPCTECQNDSDSVTGSCDMCIFAGTIDSVISF